MKLEKKILEILQAGLQYPSQFETQLCLNDNFTREELRSTIWRLIHRGKIQQTDEGFLKLNDTIMTEIPAKGQRGFLLYSPVTYKHFFRVYESEDKRTYTDYDICAEDIKIEILDNFTVLRKGHVNKLDYAKHILGD